MSSSYTELGFEINQFKFAVKLPKFMLRKPKLLKKRKSAESPESLDNLNVDWKKEFNKKYADHLFKTEAKRKSKSSSSSSSKSDSDPSFSSEEWIKEFNARYNPLPHSPKEDDHEATFYSNIPSRTSTPVNHRIFPLNRLEVPDRKIRFLPDVSGVKIYENIEVTRNSDNIDTEESSDAGNDSYEVVAVEDNKVIARAHFRPRTLKSSYVNLRSEVL